MANFLRFSMVVWTVDKDGHRYPSAAPLMLKLKTPVKDFRVSAPGFERGLFPVWATDCEQVVRMVAADKGGPRGTWAPLSTKRRKDKHGREIPGTSYAEIKRKKYPGMPMLVARGDMIQSFWGGPNHVFEQTAMGMKWGTTNPLAGYHQRGHETPTFLPTRRMWDPGPEFARAMQSDAVRYLAARYRQEGFRVGKELGVKLSRVQASRVGFAELGGFGAAPIGQAAMPI